jgi:hypothetical protein
MLTTSSACMICNKLGLQGRLYSNILMLSIAETSWLCCRSKCVTALDLWIRFYNPPKRTYTHCCSRSMVLAVIKV